MLFISSLILAALISFVSIGSKGSNSHHNQEFAAKQDVNNAGYSQFVSEEKETETEKNMEVQEIQLLFLASFLQLEFSPSSYLHQQPLFKLAAAPIYLSICNFRI